jgi:hypothetical protein
LSKFFSLPPLFASLPCFANLFFIMPPIHSEQPGDLTAGFGFTRGEYLQSDGIEERDYLPELRLDARFNRRFAASLYTFGVNTEREFTDTDHRSESEFGAGDVLLGFWMNLNRTSGKGIRFSASFQAKIPSARAGTRGTDRSDLLLGVYANRQGRKGFWQGVARMDIVGRPDRTGQWDYLTVGLRGGLILTPRWQVLGDAWHRTRGSNNTTLISAGLAFAPRDGWRISAWAGDGDHHFYETNPDSRITEQYSLWITRRFQNSALARWFGS